MVPTQKRVSITLHRDVLKLVDRYGKEENRSRSNIIETILRDHFGMIPSIKRVHVKKEPYRY